MGPIRRRPLGLHYRLTGESPSGQMSEVALRGHWSSGNENLAPAARGVTRGLRGDSSRPARVQASACTAACCCAREEVTRQVRVQADKHFYRQSYELTWRTLLDDLSEKGKEVAMIDEPLSRAHFWRAVWVSTPDDHMITITGVAHATRCRDTTSEQLCMGCRGSAISSRSDAPPSLQSPP